MLGLPAFGAVLGFTQELLWFNTQLKAAHTLPSIRQPQFDIMLLPTFLITTAWVTCTLATPLNITSLQPLVLEKRGAPAVKGNHFTKQQVQQIKEGHLDAIKLAPMIISQSGNPDTFDPIFQHYFRSSDRDIVLSEQRSCIYSPFESPH